jgi:hypothetical protein
VACSQLDGCTFFTHDPTEAECALFSSMVATESAAGSSGYARRCVFSLFWCGKPPVLAPKLYRAFGFDKTVCWILADNCEHGTDVSKSIQVRLCNHHFGPDHRGGKRWRRWCHRWH